MANFRTKVFNRAYELVKTTGKSFHSCLAKSWVIYRLSKRMTKEVVSFSYKKINGSLRTAKGTLKSIDNFITGRGSKSTSTLGYFDVDENAFRSFRIENLIEVQ